MRCQICGRGVFEDVSRPIPSCQSAARCTHCGAIHHKASGNLVKSADGKTAYLPSASDPLITLSHTHPALTAPDGICGD